MRRLLPLCLLLFAFPAAAAPTGHWEGSVKIPGHAIAFSADLAESGGKMTGTLTVAEQALKDAPLEDVSFTGATLRFSIAGIPGKPTFVGTVDAAGAKVTGDFTQGKDTVPFEMSREAGPAAKARAALAGLDATAEKLRADWKVPGVAVAVVAAGEVVYARGFGQRDVEKKLPVTADTLFAIGSCTKAFTTFVLGTLVDEGKIEWDKPVRDYVPWFKVADPAISERITLRDLTSHRTGMPGHDVLWYNNNELTRRQLVERFPYLAFNKDLRTTFQYNNLMYAAAGYLAEVVSGQTWEDLVRARIFVPLGMKRANFSVATTQQDPDHSAPYREDDKGVVGVIPPRPIGLIGPAGSINASVNEMSQWLLLLLGDGKLGAAGKPLISHAQLGNLFTLVTPIGGPPDNGEKYIVGYALGWGVIVYRGVVLLEHSGGIDGMSSAVALVPGRGIGVVVLSNLNETQLSSVLVHHIIDRLMGLEQKDRSAELLAQRAAVKAAAAQGGGGARVLGTKPAHKLEEYAGDYVDPGYGTIHIAVAGGGKLRMTYNGIEAELDHWNHEVWQCLKSAKDPLCNGEKQSFVTGLDGEVEGLSRMMEPTVPPVIFKRAPDARTRDPKFLGTFVGTYLYLQHELVVTLRGDQLLLTVPGQPVLELSPERGLRFAMVGQAGSLTFVMAGNAVTEMRIDRPEGTFVAKRKK